MKYTIREFRREDTADLARAANYEEIAERMRDAFPYPYLFADAVQFVSDAMDPEQTKELVRAICADDHVVGCVALIRGDDVHSRTAELGYWITPAYWGHGIAGQAVSMMCDEFLDGEQLDRIYATPYATNHTSHRVLEKAGFTREAVMKNAAHKNGNTIDVYLYARTAPPVTDSI